MGIKLDPEVDETKDRALAMAYMYLSVPIALPAHWRILREYSLLEARKALLDNIQDLVTSCTMFPIISDLPKDHYDSLTFSVIHPHFSKHHYNANSMRTTKLQHKQLEECESSNMANDSGSVDSEDAISLPAAKIMEVMEDIQPTGMSVITPLDTSLSMPKASTSCQHPALQLNTSTEPALLAATSNPASTSNPTSTINSTQASVISTASSTNIPPPSTSSDTAAQG
jgi:hypothetical protein